VREGTWEGKESFGEGTVEQLIRGFEHACKLEGKESALNGEETILLQEALDHGW
jgi:hypothetical protein